VAHADAALSSGDGAPSCVTCAADVAIVLLHGFAGGEFAWRHLLQPLADAVGARVLALDRPGFGGCTRVQG
jgi:pimeloyl-ACP methyl ester carboxylesterase